MKHCTISLGLMFLSVLAGPAAAAQPWGNEQITTVQGTGRPSSVCAPAGPIQGWPNQTNITAPAALAADPFGNLYVSDLSTGTQKIWRIALTPPPPPVSPAAVTLQGVGLNVPRALVFEPPADPNVDPRGRLLIADSENHRILRAVPGATSVTVIAGTTGSMGFDPNSTQPTQRLNRPHSLALAADRSLFIADTFNYRVLKLDPSGASLVRVAGNGQAPAADLVDGTQATQYAIDPRGLALDGQGNLFILDPIRNRIYKMLPDGTLRNWVGGGSSEADGVAGTQAKFATTPSVSYGMVADAAGNLYFRHIRAVGGMGYESIRKADPSGRVFTVAGGNAGSDCSGDGRAAINAFLSISEGMALDASGALYVAASGNNGRIRRIDARALGQQVPLVLEKKTSANSVTVGMPVTFTVTASLPTAATGTVTAHELTLTDTVPFTASWSPGNWDSCASPPVLPPQSKRIECKQERLPGGRSVSMTVTLRPAAVGEACNTAELTGIENTGGALTATKCVPVVASRRVEEFVLLATESMTLAGSVTVHRGAAGVNQIPASGNWSLAADLPITLVQATSTLGYGPTDVGEPGLSFATGGASIIADTVRFNGTGAAPSGVHANSLQVLGNVPVLPAVPGMPTGSFPLVELPPLSGASPPWVGGNITVASGQVLSLPPGHYGRVTVQPRGTLVLQGSRRTRVSGQPEASSDYQFRSIRLMPGPHIRARAALGFTTPPPNSLARDWDIGSRVTVMESLDTGAWSIIRPTGAGYRGSSFMFQVYGSNVGTAVVTGADSFVNAAILAPTSPIIFAPRTRAFGRFIGRTIAVGAGAEFGLD